MQFHQSTLPNGLRIVAERNERAHSVAAGFFVKAGSRDESPEVSGVSHFLEHMAFKGNDRRDALAVNRDFDRIGAKHNAQTSEEDTIFHVTCLPEYYERGFDVLADLMRPRLREEDFATEKGVILEEIKMYEDNAMMVAYDAAKLAHYGDHPLGQSILGTTESITDLSADQMRGYYERQYGAGNLVLALAGRLDWDEVLALAERRCGDWPSGGSDRVKVAAKGTGAFKTILREDDNQQTIVAVADAPPLQSGRERYAAALLATILGDHTGSRLYWELVDPGLADAADLSYQDYDGAGAWYTFLSCEPDEAGANLRRVADLYRAIAAEGATGEELERARNKVLARSLIRAERPMGRLMTLGYHWVYRGEYLSVEAEAEAYEAVTLDDIREVLDRWPLFPMTVVSVGPTTEIEPAA